MKRTRLVLALLVSILLGILLGLPANAVPPAPTPVRVTARWEYLPASPVFQTCDPIHIVLRVSVGGVFTTETSGTIRLNTGGLCKDGKQKKRWIYSNIPGTFSGGPNGIFRFTLPGIWGGGRDEIAFRNGLWAISGKFGQATLDPPDAFAAWERQEQVEPGTDLGMTLTTVTNVPVEVRGFDSVTWVPLTPPFRIRAGDSFRPTEGDSANMHWRGDDGGVGDVWIDPVGGAVTFTTEKLPTATEKLLRILGLSPGAYQINLDEPNAEWIVNDRRVTIELEGTELVVEADAEATTVKLLEGEITVTATDPTHGSVTLVAGQAVSATDLALTDPYTFDVEAERALWPDAPPPDAPTPTPGETGEGGAGSTPGDTSGVPIVPLAIGAAVIIVLALLALGLTLHRRKAGPPTPGMSAGPPPAPTAGPPPGQPPPGRRQAPPWWFFPAIGLGVVVAVVIAIVRSGGDDGPAGPASPLPASTTQPVPTATGTTTAAPSPSPEPTIPEGVVLGASCSYDPEGYGIDYPEGWSTPSQPAWVCQLFDPESFVVEPDTEPPIVAVSVYVDHHSLAKVLGALTDPAFYRVISTEQGTFADAARPGTILETEQIEEGFLPAGTRSFSVLVDRLDTTIVVTTNDLAGGEYELNKQIVLAMAESLRIAG